jgi:hypothetical protein
MNKTKYLCPGRPSVHVDTDDDIEVPGAGVEFDKGGR